MAAIKGKNTKPELLIRRALHKMGFRYRLHDKTLPGRPDMVFPKYGAAVFINGCFWHHHDCHLFKWPATREEFWREKIAKNKSNDAKALDDLKRQGWRIAVVWECALKGKARLPDGKAVSLLAEWLLSLNNSIVIEGTK